ncbi:MAG: MFS transporter [Candidatus Lokiarchaeota archaeon]|nr:MFS transporter [Candidatus Lokiarchaeota archaeon]MBD3201979.1 MFS transporter [Candidatus Lokiarchaeota archaeon]
MSDSVDKKNTTKKRRNSIGIIFSFQLGNLVWFMVNQGFRMRILGFNDNVLNLTPLLFVTAFAIFTIYNMFNDPIIGHLCDRSTRFVERWGKRFPFILMGGIPFSVILIFIFINPFVGSLIGSFIWFLVFMILFDTFFSLMDVNRWALFPKKFKGDKERKLAGFIEAILDTIGIALGFLIPMIILDPDVLGKTALGYSVQAIVISVISFILILLMIPGIKEPKEIRARQVKLDQFEYTNILQDLKFASKNRNFLGYLILFVAYSVTMGGIMGLMATYAEKIIGWSGIMGELAFLGYLIFVPVTAPIWFKISNKVGARKVLLIGAAALAVSGIPLLFAPADLPGFILTFVVASMAGAVDGAIESMNSPIFSSIVDKTAVENKKREEGLYRGVVVFFQRTSYFIWIFFWESLKLLTGELLGLRIYMSLFPLVVMTIGAIGFWKLYTISQKELERNVIELEELGL